MVLPICIDLNITETFDFTANVIVPLQQETFSK